MINKVSELNSKPHFHILDGLRGIAALVILIFHYLEFIYLGDYVKNPLGHGFLAVDFFFCLSGFVVAYAYDDRIGKIGVKGFFINRLIRLHPMVIFGTILGLIAYFSDPFIDTSSVSWLRTGFAILASITMIPAVTLPYRFGCILPLNGPAWSLFSEYFISIIYAYLIVRLGKRLIILILLLSAGTIIYSAYKFGWLSIGYDFHTFSGAFTRVIFSFTAGVAIFRFNLVIRNKGGFLLPLILLIGVFIFPHAPKDWIRESILVIIVFPLIVALGAGAKTSDRLNQFCKLIGDLSYPLYMTHFSTVFFYFNYLQSQPDMSVERKYLIGMTLVLINIIFAYVSMKLFDEPVRKWLTKLKRKHFSKRTKNEKVYNWST